MTNAFLNYLKCLFRIGKCVTVHRLLFDYVQGNLDSQTSDKLTKHLGDCPSCQEFVSSYRKTISLTRSCCAPPAREIPPELKKRLEEFIEKM